MALISDVSEPIRSNSFATVDVADIYNSERLYRDAWATQTAERKESALIWASSIISRGFRWKGWRVEEEQLLAFPRYGVVDIDGYTVDYDIYPRKIVEGTCELAFYLIQNNPQTDSPLDAGLTEIKVSTIMLKFSKEAMLSSGSFDGNGIPNNIVSIFSEYIQGSTNSMGGVVPLIRA